MTVEDVLDGVGAEAAAVAAVVSVVPGDVGLPLAAELTGVDPWRLLPLLQQLVVHGVAISPVPGRWRLHDEVRAALRARRAAARHCGDAPRERAWAWVRLHALATARALAPHRRRAPRLHPPDALTMTVEEAHAWLSDELPALLAWLRRDSGMPARLRVEVSDLLQPVLADHGDLTAWITVTERGIAAALETGEERLHAITVINSARVHLHLRDWDAARHAASVAATLAGEDKPWLRAEVALVRAEAGLQHLAPGALVDAETALHEAITCYSEIDDHHGIALARRHLGCLHLARHDIGEAITVLGTSSHAFRRLGAVVESAVTEVELARAHLLNLDPDSAEDSLSVAEAPIFTRGSAAQRGRWAEIRADLAAVRGDAKAEKKFLALAREAYDAAGDPRADSLRAVHAPENVQE